MIQESAHETCQEVGAFNPALVQWLVSEKANLVVRLTVLFEVNMTMKVMFSGATLVPVSPAVYCPPLALVQFWPNLITITFLKIPACSV